MANLYKKFGKNETSKNAEGGYKPLIGFAPQDVYQNIALPTIGSSAKLGDKYKVTTDDTFVADEGITFMDCKIHSVTSKTTTVGEDGAQSFEHSFEGIILGDSSEHLEQFEDMLNDKNIFYIKDQDCINSTGYNRFGDECSQATVKVEYDGKTTKEGRKEWKLAGLIKGKKYYYEGTITEKPAAAALSCPVVSIGATATTVTGTWANSGAHHYEAKLFSDAEGTTQVGTTAVLAAGIYTKQFTALTASTQYYLKVIPVAADGTKKNSCGLVGIVTPAA